MVVDVRAAHSLVRNLCPVDTALAHLLLGKDADLSFLGEIIEDEMARAIVAGELNPRTLMPYDCVVAADHLCGEDAPLRDEILYRDFWRIASPHATRSGSQDAIKISSNMHQSLATSHVHRLEMIKSRRVGLMGLGLSVESLHKKRKLTTDSCQAVMTDALIAPAAKQQVDPPKIEYVPRFSSLRPHNRRNEDFWDRRLLTGNELLHGT